MIAEHQGKHVYICDFCGKWQMAVEIMLQSPISETCICNECVEDGQQTIAEHHGRMARAAQEGGE